MPLTLQAANRPFTWMLDSGYATVDGAVLAKPGTPLVPGQLLFLRSVMGGLMHVQRARRMCTWTNNSSKRPSTTNRRGDLLATLQEAAVSAGADLRYGEAVEDYTISADGLVHVRTTTTSSISSSSSSSSREALLPPAHVLVGAEGMTGKSAVRRKLLGGGGSRDVGPASRGYVVYRGVAEEGDKALAPGFSFQVCFCGL